MRSPSHLFHIVFPFAKHSSYSNYLKFKMIRRYFDRKGVLLLSAEFLTKHLPKQFSNFENAKSYLRRTLRVDFNPYETDKYIIKTNVNTNLYALYGNEIPAGYLQKLSLAKNPDTLNFYVIGIRFKNLRYVNVISRYDKHSTKNIIESITKQSVVSIFDDYTDFINTNVYDKTIRDREERKRRKHDKIYAWSDCDNLKFWFEQYEKKQYEKKV